MISELHTLIVPHAKNPCKHSYYHWFTYLVLATFASFLLFPQISCTADETVSLTCLICSHRSRTVLSASSCYMVNVAIEHIPKINYFLSLKKSGKSTDLLEELRLILLKVLLELVEVVEGGGGGPPNPVANTVIDTSS